MSRKIKLPSNKNFGIVFCIVFFIIATWPILSENNIKCFSVSSVKKGVEELEKYNDDYVKIIFGSHYIAEEVYNATGKHFDTTNN